LFNDIGLPPLDIETDRINDVRSPGMLEELPACSKGAVPRRQHSEPGHS